MMIKKSEVKNHIKELGDFNVSKELYDKLDTEIKVLLTKACARTSSNKRKTVQSQDV